MKQIKKIWILILIWILSVSVYINSLGNGFISDDKSIIDQVHNPVTFITGIHAIQSLIYYLVYLTAGIAPPVFRAGNILIHAAVVTVLYLLVSKMANKTAGIISAVLFAVHPMLVESVAWISGGVYPQYSFFFLLGFYLYIKTEDKKIPVIYPVLSFLLALLSSEKAVVFPLVLLVYELLLSGRPVRWKSLSIYFGMSVVYIIMYFARGVGRVIQVEELSGVAPRLDNPVIYVATALSLYMQLFFWPDTLSFYHSDPRMGAGEVILRLVVLLFLLLSILINYKKNRLLCFWLIFSILALSITLSPYRITWIIAERYAYLSVAGAATCIALFLSPIMQKKYARGIVWIFVGIAVVALGYRTIQRNFDWRSDDTFWLATVKASPENAKAHNSLASVYADRGNIDGAIRELETAIRVQPAYVPAYYNLGVVYEYAGDTQKAIECYTQALTRNPREFHAADALKRLGASGR